MLSTLGYSRSIAGIRRRSWELITVLVPLLEIVSYTYPCAETKDALYSAPYQLEASRNLHSEPKLTRLQIPRYSKIKGIMSNGQETTRLPVRSALFKQRTGGLVVRWVTTSEYLLLYVFDFLLPLRASCDRSYAFEPRF